MGLEEFRPGQVAAPLPSGAPLSVDAHNQAVRDVNNKQIGNAIGVGVGGGAALAGLAGLYNLWRKQHQGARPTRLNPTEVVLDLPVEDDKLPPEEPGFLSRFLGKKSAAAGGSGYAPQSVWPSSWTVTKNLAKGLKDDALNFGSRVKDRVYDLGTSLISAGLPYAKYLDSKLKSDSNAKNRQYTESDLRLWPGAMLGVTVGGLGAWKGIQALNRAAMDSKQEADIEDAKKQFEQAVLRQYDKPKTLFKAASVIEQTSAELDQLYDVMEKSADMASMLGRYLGFYALPVGLGSAYLGFRQSHDVSDEVTTEKARRARLAQLYQQAPPEVFARPVPTRLLNPVEKDDAEKKQKLLTD